MGGPTSSLEAGKTEIKEQTANEKEGGELAIQAFILHNPLKSLHKSVERIEEAQPPLEIGGYFSKESGWFYNIHTIPNVQRILDIPKKLLESLLTQVENVERRNK